jgi:hypothetical protein
MTAETQDMVGGELLSQYPSQIDFRCGGLRRCSDQLYHEQVASVGRHLNCKLAFIRFKTSSLP